MQAAAEHVTYQLPNEHSGVGYLLDAILCNDAELQAAMASIKTNQAITGMRNDFEAVATHLLPYDPTQKKRVDHAGTKRGSAEISDVTGEKVNVSSFGTKKGTGSSGVPLQCHTKAEHVLLDRSQKDELCEWRKGADAKGGKDKGKDCSKNRKFDGSKAVASAAEKKVVEEKLKAMEKERTDRDDTEACVMSIFKKYGIGKGAMAQNLYCHRISYAWSCWLHLPSRAS
jgi:hypothetical protein